MSTPDGMDAMTPAEHIDHAHRHAEAAGQHADLAATHLKAAGSGYDGGDGDGDGDAGRAMPPAASPQAGYAQNRTGFAAGTGAARAHRAATGRR